MKITMEQYEVFDRNMQEVLKSDQWFFIRTFADYKEDLETDINEIEHDVDVSQIKDTDYVLDFYGRMIPGISAYGDLETLFNLGIDNDDSRFYKVMDHAGYDFNAGKTKFAILLEDNDTSGYAIAKITGIPQATIARYQSGHTCACQMNLSNAYKVADAFDITIDELYEVLK